MHRVCVTAHCLERYRERVDRAATEDVVREVAGAARWQSASPAALDPQNVPAGGWLVAGPVVFPVKREDGVYVLLTTLRLRCRPVALQREWRRLQRAEREDWAA